MIFDIIDHKIKNMKSLRRLELIKANQAQQLATDAKYRSLVSQVNAFCLALAYARDNLQFSISEITTSYESFKAVGDWQITPSFISVPQIDSFISTYKSGFI